MIPSPRVRTLLLAILALGVSRPGSVAQESLADLVPFREGSRALADGRYDTAAREFRRTWSLLSGNEAGDIERDFVASRLLESLVRNGHTSSAVLWLGEQNLVASSPATLHWSALAYQAEKRYADAARAYGELAASGVPLNRERSLQYALCLTLSHRSEAAFEIIRDLPPPRVARNRIRFAQVAARAGRPEKALEFLGDSETTADAPPDRRIAAAALRASLLFDLGREKEAISAALDRVESSESPEETLQAFLLLEEVSSSGVTTDTEERLRSWAESEDPDLSLGARLFSLILLDGDATGEGFESFLETHPEAGPFAEEARFRLLSFQAVEEALEPARLSGGEVRLDFALSSRAFRAGEFESAADRYSRASRNQGSENRSRNLFNAALSHLRNDDFARFTAALDSFRESDPESGLIADLTYLAGLQLASQGDPAAADYLGPFIREHPDHPSHVDAQLALAEIHLNQVPARPLSARVLFEGLRKEPLTLDQNERLDYAAVWLEHVANAPAALVESARSFVRDWPSSNYLPEISMLLARQYLRNGEMPLARETFERIVTDFPESEFAETARFFAVRSMGPEEEAIERWREIVDGGGPLAVEARHELGLLLLSLDRFPEARAELEALAETFPPDSPMRFAVLADVGFSHYAEALARDSDEEQLNLAADAFARLSALPDAPDSWKFSAAIRRGKCLEALGKPDVALEIYRSLVVGTEDSRESLGVVTEVGSTEWVFRAGFSAIELMSEREDWEGAIRIADALSRKDGPRAFEASRLAERMRLKHWVWD